MELIVREVHETAQYDFTANREPAFLCPNAVKCSGEREHFVLVFVEILDSFPEHIP